MLKIISMLWSSIYDLLFLVKGQGTKSLEQIEQDLDIIEMRCRPYADADNLDMANETFVEGDENNG